MCCECEQLKTTNSRLTQAVANLEREVNLLMEQLKLERLRRFGRSSEQSNPNQLQFDQLLQEHDEINIAVEKETEATEHIEYDRKKGKNHNLNGRVAIPDHLERREIVIDLPEDQKICPVTGQPMIRIGEDITEQLAVEPPQFYVNRYIRPKYASPDRRNGAKVGVKTAQLPESPVERCKADVSLLANIIVNKYADHLPLYRQEQMYQRYGIKIPANTMCDWVNNCAGAVRPLYNELKKSVLSGDYVNVDETSVDLLRKGKKKLQARLWVVRSGSGPPGMFFHFTENWQHKQAINLLDPFSNYLQTDAYAGYEKVGLRNDITLLGCLAHAPRRFVEAAKLGNKQALSFVLLFNVLYRIEHEIAALPGPVSDAAKLALRQRRANRTFKRLFRKLDTVHTLPKSTLGKAINYTRNQKHILPNYLSELRFRPDNNLALF